MVEIIKQFNNDFDKLQKQLNIFLQIKIGDKLCKGEDGFLEIDSPSNFQFIRRWWYGESREKTVEYLDDLFRNLFRLLDKILAFVRTHMFSSVIEKLSSKIGKYLTKIMTGMYFLKQTYHDDMKIICKIDACVLTIVDFKDETSSFRIQKYKRPIVRSNSFDQITPESLNL